MTSIYLPIIIKNVDTDSVFVWLGFFLKILGIKNDILRVKKMHFFPGIIAENFQFCSEGVHFFLQIRHYKWSLCLQLHARSFRWPCNKTSLGKHLSRLVPQQKKWKERVWSLGLFFIFIVEIVKTTYNSLEFLFLFLKIVVYLVV